MPRYVLYADFVLGFSPPPLDKGFAGLKPTLRFAVYR
jgi:hypothetical protein